MKTLFSLIPICNVVNVTNVALFIIAVGMVCTGVYLLKQIKVKMKNLMEMVYKSTKDPGRYSGMAYDVKVYLAYCALALVVATVCLWEILKYLFIR